MKTRISIVIIMVCAIAVNCFSQVTTTTTKKTITTQEHANYRYFWKIPSDKQLWPWQVKEKSGILTTAEDWSGKNMLYGPLEIGAGVIAPVWGLIVGSTYGATMPMSMMREGGAIFAPYTAVSGALLGSATAATASPIIIMEGLFNTLTFGAFANEPLDWFTGFIQSETGTEVIEKTEVK